jgi:hypothetical protein
MLTAAGMNRVWHHSRAHRFFATARWSLDHLGLTMLGLVVGWLVPVGAPLVIAVDDTLLRRTGRRAYGAFWAYDGARHVARGQKKLSRGNTFVVAAVVVELPFLNRPIALPVLFRLWQPGGPTKAALARDLIRLVAAARGDRRIHVVADGAYLCKTLRHLPANVTLTGPLPRHAALWDAHPEHDQAQRLRRRGRPRCRGDRIGKPADLATNTPGASMTVTRYRRTGTVTVHEHRCLWYGVFRSQAVRVFLVCDTGRVALPLITTDPTAPAVEIIERYAKRATAPNSPWNGPRRSACSFRAW